MKKINLTLSLSILFCFSISILMAQQSLGKIDNFINNLKQSYGKKEQKSEQKVVLKVNEKLSFDAQVNFLKSDNNHDFLVGSIKNHTNSTFFIEFKDKILNGHILFFNTKEAYKYSSDKFGNAFVTQVDINTLVCIDYPEYKPTISKKKSSRKFGEKIEPSLLKLESYPGAKGCIFLDFDGYELPEGTKWNDGKSASVVPTDLKDEDIKINWELVSEDYRPFSLNVTTNEAVFNTYPKNKRMRVIITPVKPFPAGGGRAIIGSFATEEDLCWVFNSSNGKVSGETASHEVGHTFDLLHDGDDTTVPRTIYYKGIEGKPFAPIMGFSVQKPVTHWDKGEYPNSNNNQDDLALITSDKFGIGYRTDDFGNSFNEANSITFTADSKIIKKNGIITNENDIDMFTFTTNAAGNVNINVKTVPINGNLDILMRLYDRSGKELGLFNPIDDLNTTFTRNLPAGKYYISISGIGSGNPKDGDYSAYASIGSYTIDGTIPNGVLSVGSQDLDLTETRFFPNPFNDELNIIINEDIKVNEIKLFDAIGKEIGIKLDQFQENKIILNTSSYSKGMYYIQVNTENNSKIFKILKQ